MKKLLFFLVIASNVYSMENKGPLNAAWFYSDQCPYAKANKLMQNQQWSAAAELYKHLLEKDVGTDYDKSMARLNHAYCFLALQDKVTGWTEYDTLCGIKPERRMQGDVALKKEQEICIVRTDQCGMGDIVHFFPALEILKKKAKKLTVVVAVRENMVPVLEEPAKVYDVTLIDETKKDTIKGVETHLVSLLGYLHIFPKDLASERLIYGTSSLAMTHVKNMLSAIGKKYKRISPIFLGRKLSATLMGGRQLPHDPKNHGRHLDAKAFEKLLQKDPSLLLIDCNSSDIRIIFDKNDVKKDTEYLLMDAQFKDRVLQLPPDKNYDTILALTTYVNAGKYKWIGFGSDGGPTNIFTRGLSQDAQNRFAYIIPDSKEYDARMEGEGKKYKHMLSSCWVYKCENPEEQSDIIMQAYKDMKKL